MGTSGRLRGEGRRTRGHHTCDGSIVICRCSRTRCRFTDALSRQWECSCVRIIIEGLSTKEPCGAPYSFARVSTVAETIRKRQSDALRAKTPQGSTCKSGRVWPAFDQLQGADHVSNVISSLSPEKAVSSDCFDFFLGVFVTPLCSKLGPIGNLLPGMS